MQCRQAGSLRALCVRVLEHWTDAWSLLCQQGGSLRGPVCVRVCVCVCVCACVRALDGCLESAVWAGWFSKGPCVCARVLEPWTDAWSLQCGQGGSLRGPVCVRVC